VHDVRVHGRRREIAATAAGFVATLVGQVDVDPAGEEVLQVPLALAVAKQHEGVRHSRILPDH
jgi:hypothetical protein